MLDRRYVRWFKELSLGDVPLVGGKNASLGELVRELAPLGVPVPDGFAVTADAFRDALTRSDAWPRLHAELDGLDKTDVRALARAGAACREIVYAAGLPAEAEAEVLEAYAALRKEYGEELLSVAVRSSATAEDLPTASFAGQHETYLNVRGPAMLLDAVRRCQASLFTDRAISYRIDQGFDHFRVALSVGVQKMVRADLASAGVMFSVDTETGFPDVVFITGAWGLGENVVQGAVDVDEFYVHKPTFRQGYRCRASPNARGEEDQDGLRGGAYPRAGRQPADQRGGAPALLPHRRAGLAARRLRHPHRGSLFADVPVGPRRWTSSGPWMVSTTRSTSSRRGPRR